MGFRVAGIPGSLAAEVRRTLRSPQYGHPAHRETATGYGPCRLCLRTFVEGVEERILFTYQPFSDPGSVPAPGPVFIHAGPCDRYEAPVFPPDLRRLPLLLEAYEAGGELVGREGGAGSGAGNGARTPLRRGRHGLRAYPQRGGRMLHGPG